MSRTEWLWGILLVALALTWQGIRAAQAVVPSLDVVHFVEAAQHLETHGLISTWRTFDQQPLFPLTIFLCAQVLRPLAALTGDSTADLWCHSAQLASALPQALSVLPIGWLLLQRCGPRLALVGCLYWIFLPECSRLGAEGLSDSLHLFWFATALAGLYAALYAMNFRYRGLATFVAGVALGLACLSRFEAILLLPAQAIMLAWPSNEPWQARLRGSCTLAAMALIAVLVAVPYWAATGKFVGKYEVTHAGSAQPADSREPQLAQQTGSIDWLDDLALSDGSALVFPTKETTTSTRRFGLVAALADLGKELPTAFGYVLLPLALLGGVSRLRKGGTRFDRFQLAFVLLFLTAAVAYSAQAGYLSTRHLALLPLLTLSWMAEGTIVLAKWRPLGRSANAQLQPTEFARPLGRTPTWAVLSVALVVVAICLIRSTSPLHASRGGHRQAGEWLAEATLPGETVLDTRALTRLYSGRSTYGYDLARWAFADPNLRYIVVEAPELNGQSPRSNSLRQVLETAAEPVATFSPAGRTETEREQVVVYRWHPERVRALQLARTQTGSAAPLRR